MILRAQECHELGDFVIAERVTEGRHFGATVENMVRHLLRRPGFVVTDVREGRRLLGSFKGLAVAVGTTFVAKEGGAGLDRLLILPEAGGSGGKKEESREDFLASNHKDIFACAGRARPHPFGGGGSPHVAENAQRPCRLAAMGLRSGTYAGELRRELAARNREWAQGKPHVESYGGDPVVVYCPYCSTGEDLPGGARREQHGNFFEPAYRAILERPEWARRFNKVHAQGRALPRWVEDPRRKWRELDSCMSSDALLMNVFCAPGASAVRQLLGVDGDGLPEFGWKAKVPLKSGLFDRTEVDMRWGAVLVEAKLTEGDFQTRKAEVVEAYRDFDAVFDRELLPRVEAITVRRKNAAEFAEAYSQEWEDTGLLSPDEVGEAAREFQTGLVAGAQAEAPREARYVSYQLIRNVLAAYATGSSFCVICDARRPDLIEGWFDVMRAVRTAELRTRLKVVTWQEVAGLAPAALREFLESKYGIAGAGSPRIAR